CQAEDGIRDRYVTGVQTCALPISGAAADTDFLVYIVFHHYDHDFALAKSTFLMSMFCDGLRSRIAVCDFFEVADFIDREVTKLVDRKSTRLNSSHVSISYAVFCLK